MYRFFLLTLLLSFVSLNKADAQLPPNCQVTIPQIPVNDSTYQFFTMSGYTTLGHQWTVTDSYYNLIGTGAGTPFYFTFPESGYYSVCVQAVLWDSSYYNSCITNTCTSVYVYLPPPAPCSIDVYVSQMNDSSFVFDMYSNDYANNAQWTVTDSGSTTIATGSGTTFNYTFTTSGTFDVCFQATMEDYYGNFVCAIDTCVFVQVVLKPDLTPGVNLIPNVIAGPKNISIAVKVTEVNQVNTDGTPIIVLFKIDPQFNFVWNAALLNVGFNKVENNKWVYKKTPNFHEFTYNQVLGAGQKSSFGIIGMFTPIPPIGEDDDKKTSIMFSILPFSGGEINGANNIDTEILNHP